MVGTPQRGGTEQDSGYEMGLMTDYIAAADKTDNVFS